MNINSNKSITFFFPYYNVSGVPVLFLRFALKLAEKGRDIFIADFENGYMHRKIKNHKRIKFIKYEKGKSFNFPENSTIVFQSILPQTLPENLVFKNSNKIIFWTLHQANFIQTIIPIDYIKNFQYSNPKFFKIFSNSIFFFQTRRLESLLNKMNKKNALFFQSKDAFDFTSRFLNLRFKPKFIPVCLDEKNTFIIPKVDKKINILWIGRLDDFKIHVLNYLIDNINKSQHINLFDIELTIVGSGKYEYKIPKQKHLNFKIKHYPEVDHDEIFNFYKNTHIFAGMGTSALEAASYGVPTILLDFYYKKIDFLYTFEWITKKEKYDLGSFIQKNNYTQRVNKTLDRRLEEFINNPKIISEKMIKYFRENHSIERFVNTFEQNLTKSDFNFKDFDKKVFKKSFLRKIYHNYKKNIW